MPVSEASQVVRLKAPQASAITASTISRITRRIIRSAFGIYEFRRSSSDGNFSRVSSGTRIWRPINWVRRLATKTPTNAASRVCPVALAMKGRASSGRVMLTTARERK